MSDSISKATQEVSEKIRNTSDEGAKTLGGLIDDKARPHRFSLIADVAVFTLASIECVLYLTTCDNCYWYTWYLMAMALVGKGAAAAFASGLHKDPPSAPKKLIGMSDGIFLILGAAVMALFPSPTIFITLAILLHTLVDIVSVQRPALRQLAPGFEKSIGGVVDSISPQVIDGLRLAGGVCEIVAFFVLPFCGSLILCAAFVGFLLLRYRSDRHVRNIWGTIASATEKGVNNAAVPPAVGQNYTKAKDALHKAATSF